MTKKTGPVLVSVTEGELIDTVGWLYEVSENSKKTGTKYIQ
jgi:hypothetical protein